MNQDLLIEELEPMKETLHEEETSQINVDVHIEVMELLLQAGADPDIIDQDDFTPLMTAAIENDIEAARLLLDHSAGPAYTNYLGYSALLYADSNKDKDLAELIQRAVDAMQKNDLQSPD